MLSIKSLVSIDSLPDEIIIIILTDDQLHCKDVLNFGETCKKFNEMIKANEIIWKSKIKTRTPPRVAEVILAESHGNWLAEIQGYCTLGANIVQELLKLCRNYYKQDTLMTLKDVERFFKMASARNINYYLVTSILSEIINEGNKFIQSTDPAPRPYNISDLFYTKIVLRYLIHSYLMLEWVINFKLDSLTPENVIYFFHQWIDTVNLHLKEDCHSKIQELVTAVEAHLDPRHPLRSVSEAQRAEWANGHLPNNAWDSKDCKEVLAAVKKVLYGERHMTVMNGYILQTLDIVKAIETNICNPTLLAALFSALCRRCGVRCDLITFSEHMFLEWREDYENLDRDIFTINLTTGELERSRRCPFAQNNHRGTYTYSADSLLTHLYGIFVASMGAIRNWSTENGNCLYEFLRTNHLTDEQGPYKNFLLFLMKLGDDEVQTPLRLKNMDSKHLDVISLLVNIHKSKRREIQLCPKAHRPDIRFAIGMVCSHVKYEYVCVIRDWDKQCNASPEWQERMAIKTLQFGADQPYYHVIVADYSERYVAQENLQKLSSPNRMYHLEDILAPEFARFDGFGYVPNEMKQLEYPNDDAVREVHKCRSLSLPL